MKEARERRSFWEEGPTGRKVQRKESAEQVLKMVRKGYSFYTGSLGWCRQRKASEKVVSVWTPQLQVKGRKRKELLIYITEKPRALSGMAGSRC